MNDILRNDECLCVLCFSGSLFIKEYVKVLIDVGFGMIEIRVRKFYCILDLIYYLIDELIYIEFIEVVVIKDFMFVDGFCVFIGKVVIYFGIEDYFDDKKGYILLKN